jgi:hypothetical protein
VPSGQVVGGQTGGRGNRLAFSVLPQRFAVCRLAPGEPFPDHVTRWPFWSVTRTGEELSVVLPEEGVCGGWRAERGWRCLKVHGPLDFSLVGILASISTVLAAAGISVFVLSTYDTDYVLVREADLDGARRALIREGHAVD